MLPDKYGIHEKTVKKADGSYDVVIGCFLCFAYTIIFMPATRPRDQLTTAVGGQKIKNKAQETAKMISTKNPESHAACQDFSISQGIASS